MRSSYKKPSGVPGKCIETRNLIEDLCAIQRNKGSQSQLFYAELELAHSAYGDWGVSFKCVHNHPSSAPPPAPGPVPAAANPPAAKRGSGTPPLREMHPAAAGPPPAPEYCCCCTWKAAKPGWTQPLIGCCSPLWETWLRGCIAAATIGCCAWAGSPWNICGGWDSGCCA
jgi:hypothetical protein